MLGFDSFISDLSINLLASLLFVGLGVALSKVALPWYQALVYGGIKVEGKWVNELDDKGAHYRYEIGLNQKGHVLTGNATIIKTMAATGNYVQDFQVTGTVWEGFVILNLQSADQKSLSLATGLFNITDRGARLTGILAYRRFESNEVESEELQLLRQGR